MSKKSKSKFKFSTSILLENCAFLFGCITLLFMLLPVIRVITSSAITGVTKVETYNMYYLAFPGSNKNANAGLIAAFSLLVGGMLIACTSAFTGYKKNKQLEMLLAFLSSLCLITAGVLFFCTLPLTGISTGGVAIPYIGAGEISIGGGLILTGLTAVIGGLSNCVATVFAYKKD